MKSEHEKKSKSRLLVIAVVTASLLLVFFFVVRSLLYTTPLSEDEHSRSWLMLGYDAARPNYNYAEKTMKPSLKQQEVLALESAPASENMMFTMFAADEANIYTLSYQKSIEDNEVKNKINAFDAKTGKSRWEFSELLLGAGAVDKDHVYCVSGNPNKVFALEVSSGKKVWESQLVKKTTGRQIYVPVVREGIVYVVSENAELFALDAKTGKKRWTYSEIQIVGSPAASRAVVYCLTQDKRVLALDSKSGEQKWVVGAPDWKMLLNPSVGNGQVYIVDRDRREATDSLIALNAQSGQLQWKFKIAKNALVNSMCVGKDRIFISIADFKKMSPENKSQGEVVSINANNGKKLWRKEVWGMPASIIGAAHTLYISSSRSWRDIPGHLQVEGGVIFAMSMGTGKIVDEYEVIAKKQGKQATYLQPPALISNGKIFAQNVLDNTIHVFW